MQLGLTHGTVKQIIPVDQAQITLLWTMDSIRN